MNEKNKLNNKFEGLKAPIDKDALWGKITQNNAYPNKTINSSKYKFLSFIVLSLAIFIYGLSFYNRPINAEQLSTINNVVTENLESDFLATENSDNLSINTKPILLNKPQNLTKKGQYILNRKAGDTNSDVDITSNLTQTNESKVATYNSLSKLRIANAPNEKNNLNEIDNNKSKITQKTIKTNTFDSLVLNENTSNDLISNTRNDILNEQLNFNQLFQDIDLLELPRIQLYPTIPPFIEVQKVRKWSLDFSAGKGKIYHQLEQNNPSAEYFELWNKNTVNLEAYSFNIGLSKHLAKGWSIKFENGLERTFRRFEYTSDIIEEIISDPDRGEGYFLLSESKNRYIQHHRYDVITSNLLLEKSIYIDGLSLILGAGLYTNLSINSTGNIYTNNNDPIRINQLAEYNTALQLSPLYSIELRTPITSRLDLFANARYKSRIRYSANSSDIEHSAFGLFASLGFGLRI